ncbi:hypothetical protein [Miltoncostaea oceani]|uniref:hypothetical protein n=1 Tax=Miltoncostaea oceani TaxID=2843216 RepID=UPI001C3D3B76|nr:hypothetical protein [Miltoncostaea oceani]
MEPDQIVLWKREFARVVIDAIPTYEDAIRLLADSQDDPASHEAALREMVMIGRQIGLPLIAACRTIEELSRLGAFAGTPDDEHPRIALSLTRVLGESMALMITSDYSSLAAQPLIDPAEVRRLAGEPATEAWLLANAAG